MKVIKLNRQTKETRIDLQLDICGEGKYDIETGIGFFNHMLELWSRHGFFDLKLKVDGDLEVDAHHTVEDTGIVLGQAINKELGERTGIKRYGQIIVPMDETLVMVALDLSGRSYYNDDLVFNQASVGQFSIELVEEFFRSLSSNGKFNLHFKMLKGGNTHHLLEACFKGFARAFDKAIQPEERLKGSVLSTKGNLGEGDNS